MIPVLTPEEMAGVDRDAPEAVDVLIERAGHAVYREARRLMGGTYARRVVVVAGRGNNGADGRVAARLLAAAGARVEVVDPTSTPLPVCDLVVDAAFGTGLTRDYEPPGQPACPVLAVDIPSGINGVTGEGRALQATATVTFAAFKPGLLLGAGRDATGNVELAGIGLHSLATERASTWLIGDEDLDRLPRRATSSHKWQTAVMVVGGSARMNGAPLMCATGAMRAGAGYALVGVPGAPEGGGLPPGAQVGVSLPDGDWVRAAAEAAGRVKAMVVGPGLSDQASGESGESGPGTPVGRLLEATSAPAVVDADAIGALGSVGALREVAAGRNGALVVTPHEGEYAKLTGSPPGSDRLAAVRDVAHRSGAVVLLKGATTVVAEPGGRVMLAAAGTPRLATAGTGDVLSGVVAAFMARGVEPFEAAALAAHVHGRASMLGRSEGLVATDLPDLVSEFLSKTVGDR